MSKPKFYTVKEFADILKVSEYQICKFIEENILKCISIDNITMIPESELERLVIGLENGLRSKNKGY